jgi:hypothetical protein
MRAFTASADGTALWLIDLETTVMRVDVDTGDRVVVSSATVGMGPTLSAPRDLVHDPDNDRLIVSTDTGAIVAIDLATGDRSEISGPNVGEGPLAVGEVFLRPEGLYLAYNHIWSLVDLDTGDPRPAWSRAASAPGSTARVTRSRPTASSTPPTPGSAPCSPPTRSRGSA